ncbi:non-hydrolyzing UDP-N-acetylglucosamine 2-epimerase [Geomonas propionica]|uniref:UDP-N-acetylglucosamine 2-epimerase (non-hydrolyzing) n=1 Tax=Geomonas propionica TaxID=2798582 RepID=A0ABS0YPK3_9BACT|nr:UDP-N-acetylglucosamine 2-epimerase (non-hydrolyzing) [Geomonas propionica]MBJ6799430.1 UDP-N-acetylglucosamine 2-epimerase (non-hydrolyzing) [Geomonas propionica]
MVKILSVFGTRPEAIKMAPVIMELERNPGDFQSLVCVTGQHRQMLAQVLDLFDIRPDFNLDVMSSGQDLFDVSGKVLQGLKTVLAQVQPDIVLVHGDTATTMAAAIACCFSRIGIGHVEAGLRTYQKYQPFPEEICRRVTGAVADLHFAPTSVARANLLGEGIDGGTIFVTGNTIVDALQSITKRIAGDRALQEQLEEQFSFLDPTRKLIIATCHRRENFGEGIENICRALAEIATSDADVEILYPVHPNPNVREPVHRLLGGGSYPNIHLVAPVEYLPFVYLINRSRLIITDSGGLQEEAPSLGKHVLVIRDVTERPEAVVAGNVRMVGTDCGKVVAAGRDLLRNSSSQGDSGCCRDLYGDGKAACRIAAVLRRHGNGLSRANRESAG